MIRFILNLIFTCVMSWVSKYYNFSFSSRDRKQLLGCMPIYRTNTCNTLNLQTLTGELRFSSSAIDKRRKEGEKREVDWWRCREEGEGRKVKGGRWREEGEGKKVKAGRWREEGKGRKVKGGRSWEEGEGRKVKGERWRVEGNMRKVGGKMSI